MTTIGRLIFSYLLIASPVFAESEPPNIYFGFGGNFLFSLTATGFVGVGLTKNISLEYDSTYYSTWYGDTGASTESIDIRFPIAGFGAVSLMLDVGYGRQEYRRSTDNAYGCVYEEVSDGFKTEASIEMPRRISGEKQARARLLIKLFQGFTRDKVRSSRLACDEGRENDAEEISVGPSRSFPTIMPALIVTLF